MKTNLKRRARREKARRERIARAIARAEKLDLENVLATARPTGGPVESAFYTAFLRTRA